LKKTLFTAFAVSTLLLATPSFANPFSGPRLSVTAGVDDVTRSTDKSDVTYGAMLGLDVALSEKAIVGVETNVANVFNRRDIGVAARLGYVVSKDTLLFVKGGYQNYNDIFSRKLDGFSVGGGIEHNLSDNFFVGAEYKHSNFQRGVGKNAVNVSVGFRL
jgi:outer membrane immunogenic protein